MSCFPNPAAEQERNMIDADAGTGKTAARNKPKVLICNIDRFIDSSGLSSHFPKRLDARRLQSRQCRHPAGINHGVPFLRICPVIKSTPR
jgi:hypothetical protein